MRHRVYPWVKADATEEEIVAKYTLLYPDVSH